MSCQCDSLSNIIQPWNCTFWLETIYFWWGLKWFRKYWTLEIHFFVMMSRMGRAFLNWILLTTPGCISTVMPSACGITRISLNIIDASKCSYLLSGCSVTSQANSGVRQTVKKSCLTRTSWNSGKYLPACRITQTGTLSTLFPKAARSSLSFFNSGKFWRKFKDFVNSEKSSKMHKSKLLLPC